MRLIFTLLLVCFTTGVFSQEIYCDKLNGLELVSLGSFDNDGKLKVFGNNEISYIETSKFEQCDQLSFGELFDYLFDNQLTFLCSGSEPFWQISLSKNNLSGLFVDTKVDKQLEMSSAYTMGWGWYAMFRSSDSLVYGIIKRADLLYNCQCGSDNVEYPTLFECYISVDNKAYDGCAIIDKIGDAK